MREALPNGFGGCLYCSDLSVVRIVIGRLGLVGNVLILLKGLRRLCCSHLGRGYYQASRYGTQFIEGSKIKAKTPEAL